MKENTRVRGSNTAWYDSRVSPAKCS